MGNLTVVARDPENLEPMKELRDEGVKVLVVSTGHGNFQVLRQVVSPPVEDHLYFVDIEDISIITEDVRNAIIGKYLSLRPCSGVRGRSVQRKPMMCFYAVPVLQGHTELSL